jgi:hypothetical protein
MIRRCAFNWAFGGSLDIRADMAGKPEHIDYLGRGQIQAGRE